MVFYILFGMRNIEKLLNSYEWFNLKKIKTFTEQGQKEFLEYEQKEIEFFIKDKKETAKLLEMYEKGLIPVEEDCFIKDTLTYVGGPEILDILNKKQK